MRWVLRCRPYPQISLLISPEHVTPFVASKLAFSVSLFGSVPDPATLSPGTWSVVDEDILGTTSHRAVVSESPCRRGFRNSPDWPERDTVCIFPDLAGIGTVDGALFRPVDRVAAGVFGGIVVAEEKR